MHFPPHASTPALLIIPISRDDDGIYALFIDTDRAAGILCENKPRTILSDQIMHAVCKKFKQPQDNFSIIDGFFEKTNLHDVATTASLVHVSSPSAPPTTGQFLPFPQALRLMRKDRSRLIFLKAWQFLMSGGANDDIKVRLT